MPNKIEQKLRHNSILQDYLSGLNYNQLRDKYKIAKSSIHYILNKTDAKKVIESTYLRRCELLPKAIEIEQELLESDNESIRLKVVQKLMDDVGIGRTHTPFALFQSVVINQLDPSARQYIDSKAVDLGVDDTIIDVDYEIND